MERGAFERDEEVEREREDVLPPVRVELAKADDLSLLLVEEEGDDEGDDHEQTRCAHTNRS